MTKPTLLVKLIQCYESSSYQNNIACTLFLPTKHQEILGDIYVEKEKMIDIYSWAHKFLHYISVSWSTVPYLVNIYIYNVKSMNSLSVYQYLVNIGIISKHSYFPHKNLSIVKCYLRALLCFLYIYTFFEVSMQGQERHSKTQGKNIHCKSVLWLICKDLWLDLLFLINIV